jgi:hypothetical protein
MNLFIYNSHDKRVHALSSIMKDTKKLLLLLTISVLLFTSCEKKFESEQSEITTPQYETRNTYLHKTVLIGVYDSVTYNATTGVSLNNLDSVAVTDLSYYRLTSKINTNNNVELPDYITEFHFDLSGMLHHKYITWYDFAALNSGSTYGKDSAGWHLTYYHHNSDVNNDYTLDFYFKEFNNISMPLPPLK